MKTKSGELLEKWMEIFRKGKIEKWMEIFRKGKIGSLIYTILYFLADCISVPGKEGSEDAPPNSPIKEKPPSKKKKEKEEESEKPVSRR